MKLKSMCELGVYYKHGIGAVVGPSFCSLYPTMKKIIFLCCTSSHSIWFFGVGNF